MDDSMNKSPQTMLLWITFVMSLVFSIWQVLLNNFVIERAAFTGAEIGMLQSYVRFRAFLPLALFLFLSC